MLLRDAAFEYIGRCNLKTEIWNELFNPFAPFNDLFPNALQCKSQPLIVRADDKLMQTINAHLSQEVFDQVMTGGPFGKDAQIYFGSSYPGPSFLFGKETLEDAIRRRQALWDKGFPWTEGLAQMFDAAQEELFFQLDVIGEDARRAEARFIKLSPLQQVAHKHLVSVRSGDVVDLATGSDRWLPLLRELDARGISLDSELQGKAKGVLMALRRKGRKIATWEQCYDPKARVTFDDGKSYDLKREVTHAIHNAAKVAAYHLGKIWNPKTL